MSRRDQIRLSDEEVREFLTTRRTIILNSIDPEGLPHPMPMWFAYGDDGTVAMTTFTKSQKIKNLERDPRVTLLAEDGAVYEELRAAIFYGTAELVHDTGKVADILGDITQRTGGA
ncbi:MAG: pyridoxamine 5'-phosphate oxidase family protein, partial [Phycisphaerales bacterium]|nr:pyridoxamine 5'-phosphate oxidase family protein [Phycisphaerales bacterium]